MFKPKHFGAIIGTMLCGGALLPIGAARLCRPVDMRRYVRGCPQMSASR
jgi:hypothetical protein